MTLPKGYRPSGLLRFASCYGINFASVDITAGGQLVANIGLPVTSNLLINLSFIAEA